MHKPRQIVKERWLGRRGETGWVVADDSELAILNPRSPLRAMVPRVETIIFDINWEGPVEIGMEVVDLGRGPDQIVKFAAKKPA